MSPDQSFLREGEYNLHHLTTASYSTKPPTRNTATHQAGATKMSGYQSSSAVGELWLQWFSCCINQPAQQRKRQQRRRIDRSMIGEPTNFQHTGHIGSGDVEVGNSRLRAIQSQMQSKGGYETSFTTLKAY